MKVKRLFHNGMEGEQGSFKLPSVIRSRAENSRINTWQPITTTEQFWISHPPTASQVMQKEQKENPEMQSQPSTTMKPGSMLNVHPRTHLVSGKLGFYHEDKGTGALVNPNTLILFYITFRFLKSLKNTTGIVAVKRGSTFPSMEM